MFCFHLCIYSCSVLPFGQRRVLVAGAVISRDRMVAVRVELMLAPVINDTVFPNRPQHQASHC